MANFTLIVEREDGEPLESGLTFSDGQSAAMAAKERREADGKPWKVKRVISDLWKERERKRFVNGEYERTPFHGESWFSFDHLMTYFPHMSKKQPGMIAYTESPEKGDADRQTVIAPGRYLTRFFSEVLNPEQINHWVAKCQVDGFKLKFIRDSAGIAEVYAESDIDSCMAKSSDCFDCRPHHPCEVYGGNSDLTLAVLYDATDSIIARALVWESEKIHGRVYGHIAALKNALADAGFSRGSFDGAKIRKIEHHGRIVCPYIDSENSGDGNTGCVGVDVKSDCLVINEDGGDYEAGDTDGYLEGSGHRCDHCGDLEEDLTYVDSVDGHICDYCLDREFFRCDDCGEWHSDNEYNRLASGDSICDGCFINGDYFTCDDCGESYHINDFAGHTPDGEAICDGCAQRSDLEENEDGELVPRDELESEEEGEEENESQGAFAFDSEGDSETAEAGTVAASAEMALVPITDEMLGVSSPFKPWVQSDLRDIESAYAAPTVQTQVTVSDDAPSLADILGPAIERQRQDAAEVARRQAVEGRFRTALQDYQRQALTRMYYFGGFTNGDD